MARRPRIDRDAVSELTTARLSVYVRCLAQLEAEGQKTVSSHELALRFHLNSAQIRKDLACFGEFGTRGVGYDVSRLREQLTYALGTDRTRNILIAGAGNLGLALAEHNGFNRDGFRVVALTDSDPAKVGGTTRSGIPIHRPESLRELVVDHTIELAIIAVDPANAQHVYDALADAGIRAILNFAPVQLETRSGVATRNVDLRMKLEWLSYHLRNGLE